MSAKRMTTGITLEPAVMHYVRTKSKELGINGSQFIESCIGLEILNPLNHKTIPKAMKIAATVELIGLEKAREALSEESDLTLTVIPKETPVFEPETRHIPKQGELPPAIKRIVEETVKKNIPMSNEVSVVNHDINSKGNRDTDDNVTHGVNRDMNHGENHASSDVADNVTDNVTERDKNNVTNKTTNNNKSNEEGSKTEQTEQVISDIIDRIEEITIDSVVNDVDEHEVNCNKGVDMNKDTGSGVESDVESDTKKKRIMKMI